MVPPSKDVVRMTSDHLVLVGIMDHKTFTAKVLGDHTWEVSVTSPREVLVRAWQIQWTLNVPVEQQFHR